MQTWHRTMASPATCRRYAVWAGRKLGGARTVQRALAPPFFAIRRLSEKTIDSPHVEGLRRPPPPPSTAEVNLPLRNRGHYSRTPNYPARESYPALPSELFQKPLDVENAQKIAEWFSREIALLPTEEQVHRPHGPLWRHKLVAQWGDTEFRAIGEDASKEHAQAAALMHLILQLHSHNLLSRLRLSDSRVHAGPELLGQLTLQERFSKLHVYNYAARFGLLPQVSYYRARNSGVGFTWTIALPEHDILATASAREMNDAELLACIKFKREAEARWQRLGLPALQLSDGISVGLHNAAKLIGYWESLQGGVTIKFKATRLYAKFESKLPRWRVSPIWRKERLSIPLDCDVGSATLGQAKCIAEIITAVALTQMNPDLLERFEAALQVNGGNLPIRAPPIKLVIPDGGVSLQNAVEMLEASHLLHMDVTELGGYDEPRVDVPLHENSILFAINMREFMHTTQRSAQSRSEELLLRHIPAQNSGRRRTLPVNRFQDEILALVEENPISIITGSTGSGKSTQIPQIILEDAIRRGRGASCNIICTQPRRIAAASLAQHVADERGEALGEVVGYHVGGESAECHYGGSITYCTAEILVLQLELGLEQVLNGVSHIIVDEVHERDQPTERLLATLRMAFAYHMSQGKPVPRLILMTATLDIDLFERYYQQRLPDGSLANPATLQVPGGRGDPRLWANLAADQHRGSACPRCTNPQAPTADRLANSG
ncbi:hypothetical protein EJ06DRAFT_246832 [Trichodelitschia bisporula]|uniref:Helicase ATP-binding domain-containing protein n=1 Tax=Trichodelitschia bisporula TaxID=703511 RepID=A0A6G1HJL5_9PEZI|nr:hypothetical protein EJ06DRAFT_246832 [Trichodelitschia bisporula]